MRRIHVAEAELAALIVVDVQEKMLPAIGSADREEIVNRIERLVRAAGHLEIPVLFTEQYPQGLGATVARLRNALGRDARPIVKTTCSCWRDENFRRELQLTGREHVIVTGLETHVCIQQTVLDLLRMDYIPFVAADACGSRFASDADLALARMRQAGAQISSAESLIFELVERCDHPKFKDLLKLVK